MADQSAKVLVVEGDRSLRELLELILEEEHYDVRAASNTRQVLGILQTWRPDLIVLDLWGDMDGSRLRAELRRLDGPATSPIVYLSEGRDLREVALAPDAIVPKPFTLEELLGTVAGLLRRPAPNCRT